MYRYRVDFYISDKIVGHTFVNAWSRKEAWFESFSTKQYNDACDKAKINNKHLYWDATRLTHIQEI